MCIDRIGHHSTSDDSSAYRSSDDVKFWDKQDHPISRAYNYLVSKGIWSESRDTELRQTKKKLVMEAFREAEAQPKPPIEELFRDVYDNMPSHIETQLNEIRQHVAKYPNQYPTNFSK